MGLMFFTIDYICEYELKRIAIGNLYDTYFYFYGNIVFYHEASTDEQIQSTKVLKLK